MQPIVPLCKAAASAALGMAAASAALAPLPDERAFPDLGLTLLPPELAGAVDAEGVAKKVASSADPKLDFDRHREWLRTGAYGDHDVSVGLYVYRPNPELQEPGDVADAAVEELRERDGACRILDVRYPEGPYGFAPFLSIAHCALPAVEAEDDDPALPEGEQWLAAGLLERRGYVVRVSCRPVPDDATRVALAGFLEGGILYEGPERDPEWTTDEIRERWERDAPEDLHEDFVKALKKPSTFKKFVVRTDHYLILTNSSSGKTFAKAMEENYDTIAEMFPFEEIEGRRLMPVFLFRTPDQYYDFYAKMTGASLAEAKKSKGHAWRDYYATWYEAPGDPVHIHECTHQIFRNRLYLGGAGSWYQEGVAEYVETDDNERGMVAREVEKGRATSLRDLVKLRSLLYSSKQGVKGNSVAGDHYKQSALLIEFLRESRFGKDRFEEFLYAMGRVPRNDVEGIDAVFQEVYGKDLEGMDEEWQEYCKKR